MCSHRRVWVNIPLIPYFIMFSYLGIMEICINKVFYRSQKMALWTFGPLHNDELKKFKTKSAILSVLLHDVNPAAPSGRITGFRFCFVLFLYIYF